LCRSFSKAKSKKAAQSSKMTADWVDSLSVITISDDDDDDEAAAADDKRPAAESAKCDADQPSALPEKTEAAKPSDMEVSDTKTVCGEEIASAMDAEPSAEIPVNVEKSSVEIPSVEEADGKFPAQFLSSEPHHAAVSLDVNNAACEPMDTDSKNSEAEVPVAGSVKFSTGSPLVDMPEVDESQALDSRSTDDKNECSTAEDDRVYSNGLLSCYFVSVLS